MDTNNINVDIDKVEIGDKFSTETKLLESLGYPKASGNSRLSFLKDAQRYIDYNKTGKISRGKETNEIIITDKYIEPKETQDGRTSVVIQYLKPLILSIDNKSIGNKNLFLEELQLVDVKKWQRFKSNNRVEFYKYYLLNDFKGKVKTSLKQLYKENDWFYFAYEHMLITVLEDGKWSYEIADKTKSEYIDTMRLNIKERLVARHKLKYSMEKDKTWKQLSYRYTTTLYKMINEECKEAFGVDRCVDVITIEKSQDVNLENEHLRDCTKELRKYYKVKMNEWVNKNKDESESSKELIQFHNELWT
jgi:hypothetical protein